MVLHAVGHDSPLYYAIEFLIIHALRQHSLYSLVHNSSDERKMCPMKKQTDICVFFIFSSDMTKSVGYLSKWPSESQQVAVRTLIRCDFMVIH